MKQFVKENLAIVAAIVTSIAKRKRREAFVVLAARLKLSYSPEKDELIPLQFGFLDKLAQGSNRYAYNILSGHFEGYPVKVFDYHYETHSRDSKGNRHTHHHHQ